MGYADTYASNHARILSDLARSQAEAKLQSGAAWGQAIGNIGQIAANLPGQLADERRAKQQEQIWQANIDKFNQERQEDQWLKDAINSSFDQSTGDIDERRLTENLQLLGAAELAPRAVEPFRQAKMAKAQLDNALMQGQINEAEYGQMQAQTLAPYAQAIIDADGDPAVLSAALAAVRITHGAQMADGLKQALAENPGGVLPFVQSLVVPEKDKPSVSVGKDAGLWNPNTNTWDVERPEAVADEPKTLEQLITQAQIKLGNAKTPEERAAARAQINEAVKTKAALEGAGRQGPAPSYQWVTMPDGTQKLMSANEIRATPGAAPPSASRSADAPAGVKSELASIGTLSDMLTQIETVGEKNNWKGIGGFGVGAFKDFIKRNIGSGEAGEQELRNTISNVLAEIAKLRGGTAFTVQEQALLERYTPTINESAESVMGKVKSLKSFLATKQRNIEQQFMGNGAPARAGGAGSGANPETPDERAARLIKQFSKGGG